ncbi:MAG TPA: M10 family metallopeptidase C-terminal domain-containing protein [Microvirga sp.]|jgi:Ca2+-binding RTX toxin-like protein
MTELDTLLQQVGGSFASSASTFAFTPPSLPQGFELPDGVVLPQFIQGTTGRDNLVGTSSNDVMNGLEGNDVIKGGGGVDMIVGGAGNDTLTGGTGEDIFIFTARLSKTANVDRIVDFKPKDDAIFLSRLVFTKVGGEGLLKSGSFVTGSKAADASDRIVYDKATGALFYDRDGSGGAAQVKFAQVKAGTALTFRDFLVGTLDDLAF